MKIRRYNKNYSLDEYLDLHSYCSTNNKPNTRIQSNYIDCIWFNRIPNSNVAKIYNNATFISLKN
jgi:hypothetical protein